MHFLCINNKNQLELDDSLRSSIKYFCENSLPVYKKYHIRVHVMSCSEDFFDYSQMRGIQKKIESELIANGLTKSKLIKTAISPYTKYIYYSWDCNLIGVAIKVIPHKSEPLLPQ